MFICIIGIYDIDEQCNILFGRYNIVPLQFWQPLIKILRHGMKTFLGYQRYPGHCRHMSSRQVFELPLVEVVEKKGSLLQDIEVQDWLQGSTCDFDGIPSQDCKSEAQAYQQYSQQSTFFWMDSPYDMFLDKSPQFICRKRE